MCFLSCTIWLIPKNNNVRDVYRYTSLKSWKIDNIDLTQQFTLSIFTDFRYQSRKITWLLSICIDTDFYRLTIATPRILVNAKQLLSGRHVIWRDSADRDIYCWLPVTRTLGNSNLALRDGPLENLWGGGGGEVQKNIRARENLMKKNSCTPINPKPYSCYGLKKIRAKNLITKKNSCGLKIPLPPLPITFLMVRP